MALGLAAMPGILVSMSEGSLLEGRGSGTGVNLSSTVVVCMVGAAMSGNSSGIGDDVTEGPVVGVSSDEQPSGVDDDMQGRLR